MSDGSDVEGGVTVDLPTGTTITVMVPQEADFIRERVALYTEQYAFTNIADLAELDRIVSAEMLLQRYIVWLSAGHDYNHGSIDEQGLRSDWNKQSLEVRRIKNGLGMDKVTRDKTKGTGSAHEFLGNLLVRAKAMGVHRENQLDKALELFNELIGMATFWKNADPDEAKEFGQTAEDIVQWVLDVAWPEYEAIDAHFREHEQKLWIRQM